MPPSTHEVRLRSSVPLPGPVPARTVRQGLGMPAPKPGGFIVSNAQNVVQLRQDLDKALKQIRTLENTEKNLLYISKETHDTNTQLVEDVRRLTSARDQLHDFLGKLRPDAAQEAACPGLQRNILSMKESSKILDKAKPMAEMITSNFRPTTIA